MIQATSSMVYHAEVLPTLGYRQKEVYQIIEKTRNITNMEIAKLLNHSINTVTPRTNELVKLGLIHEDEKRKCSVTGRTAIAWAISRNTLF